MQQKRHLSLIGILESHRLLSIVVKKHRLILAVPYHQQNKVACIECWRCRLHAGSRHRLCTHTLCPAASQPGRRITMAMHKLPNKLTCIVNFACRAVPGVPASPIQIEKPHRAAYSPTRQGSKYQSQRPLAVSLVRGLVARWMTGLFAAATGLCLSLLAAAMMALF